MGLLLVLIIPMLLAGCSFYQGETQQGTTQPAQPIKTDAADLQAKIQNQADTKEQAVNSVGADIANWKTYSNTKYNFSFKYPADLAYKASEPSKVNMSSEIVDDGVGHTVFNLLLENSTVKVSDTFIALSIQKRENNNPITGPAVAAENILEKSETAIESGEKAVRYLYKALSTDSNGKFGENVAVQYIVEKGGYVYTLDDTDVNSEGTCMLDKIVPTIKFYK